MAYYHSKQITILEIYIIIYRRIVKRERTSYDIKHKLKINYKVSDVCGWSCKAHIKTFPPNREWNPCWYSVRIVLRQWTNFGKFPSVRNGKISARVWLRRTFRRVGPLTSNRFARFSAHCERSSVKISAASLLITELTCRYKNWTIRMKVRLLQHLALIYSEIEFARLLWKKSLFSKS